MSAKLVELPGIGPWTAHYLAMRALHVPDAFPASDLGIQKALQRSGPKQAEARAEAWRPYRSYAVLQLWTSLSEGPSSWTVDVHVYVSPCGPLTLAARGDQLVQLHLPDSSDAAPIGDARPTPILRRAANQLAEYFAGKRTVFELDLAAEGTPFQRRVWDALVTIPFGTTTSYGAIARTIGRPAASRAVGAANGRNPIAIIVPCHRVIGSTGALTGFGGGPTG